MTKIIKKLNGILNKGLAPYEAEGFRSGFVLLYVIVLSSIILAIALGVSNIALKELNFSTSGKDANDAFFAADTGVECALYWDKGLDVNLPFPNTLPDSSEIACADNPSVDTTPGFFSLSGLGSSGNSCAVVTVDKLNPPFTVITSKGYNVGNTSGGDCLPMSNSVERELEVTYQ